MEPSIHNIENLFAQLGLPSSEDSIQQFITAHRPLAPKYALHQAPFWTKSQAEFLREQITNDADWAGVIDEFDSRLRL